MLYDWIKALHIISLICWMAGMLYLPRLFVYHCGATKDSETDDMLKRMEYRLLRFIMNPAMIATLIFGITLICLQPEWLHGHWLHAKFLLVLLMLGMHGALSRWRKDFAANHNRRSARFYRLANEVPTVLMIGIVILAVVKPF